MPSRLGASEKTTDGNDPARWDAKAIRPDWTPLWDSELRWRDRQTSGTHGAGKWGIVSDRGTHAARLTDTGQPEPTTVLARHLRTVMTMADLVCRGTDLQDVLDQGLRGILELLPVRAAWIFLKNDAADRLELAAHRGTSDVTTPGSLPLTGNDCTVAIHQQKPTVRDADDSACEPLCAQLAGNRGGCALSLPLVCQGQGLGVLNLALDDLTPADDVVPVLETIASLLGMAVQKQQFLSDIQQRNADKAGLLKRLLMVQEDERQRISRELHDETGQALTSVLIGLKWMEQTDDIDAIHQRLKVLKTMVTVALDDVHKLSVDLRPTVIDDMGLASAIRSFANAFQDQHGTPVALAIGEVPADLPPTAAIALFRVVQEAFTNIAKYAVAKQIRLDLRYADQQVRLTVSDDGVGFDPTVLAAAPRAHRLGLLGMQERMFAVDGHCTIEATPGAGTRVTACVPLPTPPTSE